MRYAQINPIIAAKQPVLAYYDTDAFEYSALPASDSLVVMSETDWDKRKSCALDYLNGVFYAHEDVPPTIEQLRETMIISNVNARLNLSRNGYLLTVFEHMNKLADDDELKIMWNHALVFNRLNPMIVGFCTDVLGLDDLTIDSLFTA